MSLSSEEKDLLQELIKDTEGQLAETRTELDHTRQEVNKLLLVCKILGRDTLNRSERDVLKTGPMSIESLEDKIGTLSERLEKFKLHVEG